jgi:CO/xanthine dehydrogenase Mo-binding subunit
MARRFTTTTVEVEGREETKVVEVPAFEPTAWGQTASLEIVGCRVPRVDAREKVTGRAVYTADVERPGMLYAAILRASIPRGRVTAFDAAPALAIPGVVDVISADDLPGRIKVGGVALFDRQIFFAGQALAAVCAETRHAALLGVRAVAMGIDPMPFAVTFEQATAADAPPVRDGARAPAGEASRLPNTSRSSPKIRQRGDVEAGLADAEIVLRRQYRTPAVVHTALEPHGTTAEWEGDRLTVWESTQAVFMTRDEIASGLGLPLSSVRVIKEHMGGGFGAKNGAGAHTFAAALFARRTGRPVRCINDREGEQLASGHRFSTVQRVTLGARRDGRLTAIVCEIDIPMGIGGWEASPAKIYHELYSCPNVRTTETFAYVNTQAMDSFRAPGHTEGAFGLESAMNTLAHELAIDPLDLRLANFAEMDEEKRRPYSSNRLRDCYRVGAERFGWRRTGDGSRFPVPRSRGVGMAAQIWSAGGGPPAYAIVKLNPDGTADVLAGTQDLGTGARTVLAQIAAESLGTRLDAVRVILGDTERTPYTGNSWGSMTTASVGPAVRMAACDAREQILEAAAQLLQVEDVSELSARAGVVTHGPSGRTLGFDEIGDKLGDVMIIGRGSRAANPSGTALVTVGAQFAEVEVDVETGVVRVLRIVAVHDAGRIINPLLAESQLEGGIIQGLGFALFEERALDASLGIVLNPTMHDYKIPTMCDIPEIDATFLDVADPIANHTGARGLAEPPIIPTAPAIAAAVADALGVEVTELPLTPWRVLNAIDASR